MKCNLLLLNVFFYRHDETRRLVNMPALNIPAFTGPLGLPMGAQLVARRFDDDALLRHAVWVDRHIRG